ncbi:MAG: peptidase and subtilisin kexin sedolisin [Chloroflexi bacterium]|nr:peptidase and subtilisin kexin sedolisin [Chloroflexota bacterium]
MSPRRGGLRGVARDWAWCIALGVVLVSLGTGVPVTLYAAPPNQFGDPPSPTLNPLFPPRQSSSSTPAPFASLTPTPLLTQTATALQTPTLVVATPVPSLTPTATSTPDAGPKTIGLVTPNDELYDQYQWNLRQVRVPEAWEVSTGSSAVIVAVLDTGVSSTHPDLSGRLAPGYDFVNDRPTVEDDHGNGTHVAGIIGATGNNRLGVAGIAWQTRIMPIKVLDSSARGDTGLAARGVIWAVDHGASIINLGLAGPQPSEALEEAIEYAYSRNVLVVAPVASAGTSEISYPAAGPRVIAVAATDRSDRRTELSNTGSYISVAAPGDQIASTFKPPSGPDGYAVASTTAQAAAHVSGVAALMLSVNPTLAPDEIRSIVEATADDGGRGANDETGHGRINASRALQFVAPWNQEARGAGSYVASSSPTNNLYFPLVMKNSNGWSTSLTVLNTGNSPANLTLELFDDARPARFSYAATLAPLASTTIRPDQLLDLPDRFLGAAVVSGDASIVGVLNEDRAGSDRLTYEGFGSGSPSVWIPLLMRAVNGWNTGLQVQNLGLASTSVRVTYYTRDATTPLGSATFALLPLASRSLYQPADPRIPDGWVGSATVESLDDQPLAAIVNQVRTSGAGMSYVGVGQSGPSLWAPLLFKSAEGWATGLQVQNAGLDATVVQATYMPSNGDSRTWTEQRGVAAGASTTFYQPGNTELPDDFVGSAEVRSTGNAPVVGVVNQVRSGSESSMAYNAMLGGAESLYVPLVYRAFAGWNSGIQVQNAGSATATVTLSFVYQEGMAAASLTEAIEPSGSRTFYLPALEGLPPSFVGSVFIDSLDGQPIAAIVNHVK